MISFVITLTRSFYITKPRCFRLGRWRLYRWWLVGARYESYDCNQRHPVMRMHERAWRRGFFKALSILFLPFLFFPGRLFLYFLVFFLLGLFGPWTGGHVSHRVCVYVVVKRWEFAAATKKVDGRLLRGRDVRTWTSFSSFSFSLFVCTPNLGRKSA